MQYSGQLSSLIAKVMGSGIRLHASYTDSSWLFSSAPSGKSYDITPI